MQLFPNSYSKKCIWVNLCNSSKFIHPSSNDYDWSLSQRFFGLRRVKPWIMALLQVTSQLSCTTSPTHTVHVIHVQCGDARIPREHMVTGRTCIVLKERLGQSINWLCIINWPVLSKSSKKLPTTSVCFFSSLINSLREMQRFATMAIITFWQQKLSKRVKKYFTFSPHLCGYFFAFQEGCHF